jgi:hypothetical protein
VTRNLFNFLNNLKLFYFSQIFFKKILWKTDYYNHKKQCIVTLLWKKSQKGEKEREFSQKGTVNVHPQDAEWWWRKYLCEDWFHRIHVNFLKTALDCCLERPNAFFLVIAAVNDFFAWIVCYGSCRNMKLMWNWFCCMEWRFV